MALVREGFDEQEVLNETYFALKFDKLGIVPSVATQELMSMLSGIKVVLTNNHGEFVRAILTQIGIVDRFSAIYGIDELGLIQKPDHRAFQIVLDSIGIKQNVVFIDDEIKNVIVAIEFGWAVVLMVARKKNTMGFGCQNFANYEKEVIVKQVRQLANRYEVIYNLRIVDKLELGWNSDAIYRAVDANGKSYIMKIGVQEKSIKEIIMNSKGYKNLTKVNLKHFIPEVYVCEIKPDYAIMIMDDCGDNFLTQIKNSRDVSVLYNSLVEQLKLVYSRSKKSGAEGQTFVADTIVGLIFEQYNKYLRPIFDPNGSLVQQLNKLETAINLGEIKYCCFSNWDFTPEDVYLTPVGLKYSDPHEEVLGIPIIDMACFSALVKLYNLPKAEFGYKLLLDLGMNYVPNLLAISPETATEIFFLGRLLQRFLSTRARINKDFRKAKEIFKEGINYLQKIVGT